MSMKKNWLNMYKKRKASYDGNDVVSRSNNLSLQNSMNPTVLSPLNEVSSTPSIPVSEHTQLPADTWTNLVSCHPIIARGPEHQTLYDELRKTCYLIEAANLPTTSKNGHNFIPDVSKNTGSADAKPAFQLTYRAMLARKGFLARNTLGSGSYSKVKKVLNCNEYPVTVAAVKIIDRLKTPKDYQEKFMPRELEIWPQLKHPNLVALLDHFCDVRRVFMVLEYVSGGDALQYIQKNGAVGECVAQRWSKQIVDAVQYLHNSNITHRDLKLENILITEDEQIKICDFGFIKRQADNNELSKTYCGSRSYAAPEILMGRPYDPKKTDVWAIGVILYIFVFGNMPFDETKGTKSMLKEQEAMDLRWIKYKNKLSPHCQQLLVKTFTWDFENRPDIHFLQRSAWFSYALCTSPNGDPCSHHKGIKAPASSTNRMGSDSRPCRTLSPLLAAAAAVLADEKDMCEERCCEGVRTMLDGLKPSRSKSETNLLTDAKSSSEGKKPNTSQRARSRYRAPGSSKPAPSSQLGDRAATHRTNAM